MFLLWSKEWNMKSREQLSYQPNGQNSVGWGVRLKFNSESLIIEWTTNRCYLYGLLFCKFINNCRLDFSGLLLRIIWKAPAWCHVMTALDSKHALNQYLEASPSPPPLGGTFIVTAYLMFTQDKVAGMTMPMLWMIIEELLFFLVRLLNME